jgi:hypothetical protein
MVLFFSHFRYTKWLWGMGKSWLGIPSIRTHEWTNDISLKEWWTMMPSNAIANRKTMATLNMLVSWTI